MAGAATAVPTALSLDHVGWVARDMAALRATLQRLGFSCTEPKPLLAADPAGGPARSLQQESCHVVLGAGYLELSAVSSTDPAHHLAAYRARGDGLHILALGTPDPDAAQAACRGAGVPVSAVADAARRIDYGAHHGEARFRWFMLTADAAPEGLVCLVRNETPQLVFQPEVQAHENGATALVELVVQAQAQAFETVLARYAGLPGAGAAGPGERAAELASVALAGGCITVGTPAALRERFGATLEGVPAGRFAAVGIRVRDLAATARLLAERGVPCEQRAGALVVPAAAACGAAVVFSD